MALIKCTECGKEISDKSKQCIHCGYPIENSDSPKIYDAIFIGFDKGANIFLAKSILEQIFNVPKDIIAKLQSQSNVTIISGIKSENIESLKSTFDEYKCIVKFVESNIDIVNEQNADWEEHYSRKSLPVSCPRCGSTQITTSKRGYSFWTGFLGSNKTVNRCAKCGYSWQP